MQKAVLNCYKYFCSDGIICFLVVFIQIKSSLIYFPIIMFPINCIYTCTYIYYNYIYVYTYMYIYIYIYLYIYIIIYLYIYIYIYYAKNKQILIFIKVYSVFILTYILCMYINICCLFPSEISSISC